MGPPHDWSQVTEPVGRAGAVRRNLSVENGELLAELSALGHEATTSRGDLLAHLAELDERRLHLDLGLASLFAYCTESLCLSEPAAGRRIAAARVCRRFPEAFELVARGELHLSALCALGPRLDAANANDLFHACKHKTRRQIDELLAVRFPAPDVRAQIRRLPARPASASTAMALTGYLPEKLAASGPPAQSERPVEAEVPCPLGDSAPARGPAPPPPPPPAARAQRRAIEPLSVERFGVHFTADARLRDKIEQARAREAYLRDQGQCVSADGRRCAARTFLELDHIRPWATGAPTEQNLRLCCHAHNQHHARLHFGKDRIQAALEAARAATYPER